MHTKLTNSAAAAPTDTAPAPAWRKLSRSLMLGGALLTAATLAHAQYVWIDAQGHKVYSDRSPPASVPLKNVIRAPGLGSEPRGAAAQAMPDATDGKGKPGDGAGKPAGPMTTSEREADYRKRRAEAAEKEKKDAEEAKRRADMAAACADLRGSQKTLAAGVRMTATDENGKRTFLSDEERKQRADRVANALKDCD
jgi:hypothetical protein